MTDRYAVFGNPIAHSRSPRIHTLFAVQTAQDMVYEAVLAPRDGFLKKFRENATLGLRGANVTVPFKEEAYRLASRLTPRAERAGAVNTLCVVSAQEVLGDNTDGAGLVTDLTGPLGLNLRGKRILLLGAGGAARGVLAPLLAEQPSELVIANRTPGKAADLARAFSDLGPVSGGAYETLAGRRFDLVINGTSASLGGELPPLPDRLFAPGALAYDMMYGQGDTPFLAFARSQGAEYCADGLGMLVGQAAEAFYLWRGVRPDAQAVLATLRAELAA